MSWWRGGVLYQIYPRSFADSNDDGIGDLEGVIGRLEYLAWLGVDGIWLTPTMPSPNADWGYDVADYLDVHPDLGTLADLDRLVDEAGKRGIRVLLDLVPNHTSDRHAWFLEASGSRDSPKRDWYVWADPGRDGSPPNDWEGSFGGSTWELDERTGQYYLHHFLAAQPDLNWRNPEVREAFDEIIRFWFARGIAGFRIDVAHEIVKDRELRVHLPETHAVLRRWRSLADGFDPPRILVGETWLLDLAEMAAFYGTGDDELHLAFNFPFIFAPFAAATLCDVVEKTEMLIPATSWPVWTLSNHDNVRFPTRWCDGEEPKVRCALLILFALRGTPVLYYGDELGLAQTDVPSASRLDGPGRDGARTPMPWTSGPQAGFTAGRPWLPLGEHGTRNVADQRGDSGSTLTFCRALIALRRELPDLREGAYSGLRAPDGVWAWRRGQETIVAVNLSDRAGVVDSVRGVVRLDTGRRREGESVSGRLSVEAGEGVVVSA